jgi:gamma-glutamylcyclotransferase (GGCT)/AIG2-like uncharacterized protein YtfP
MNAKAKAQELLFTYGSLQWETIQQQLFGKKLRGSPDRLIGFRQKRQKLEGLYPIVYATGNPQELLDGIVYEITKKDLQKADVYEGEGYQRIKTRLESGRTAWVYVGI